MVPLFGEELNSDNTNDNNNSKRLPPSGRNLIMIKNNNNSKRLPPSGRNLIVILLLLLIIIIIAHKCFPPFGEKLNNNKKHKYKRKDKYSVLVVWKPFMTQIASKIIKLRLKSSSCVQNPQIASEILK